MNHLTRIKDSPNLSLSKSRFSYNKFAEKEVNFLGLVQSAEWTYCEEKIQHT